MKKAIIIVFTVIVLFFIILMLLKVTAPHFLKNTEYRSYQETGQLWTGELKIPPLFKSSFESKDEIQEMFVLNKIEPHGWSLTEKYKSHGSKSLVITIKSGDKMTIEKGEKKGLERADFQDPLFAPFNPELEIWHRIDFMILDEKTFPLMDERLVFIHFKQVGGNNPLFSMRYINGRLYVKLRYSDIQKTYTGPGIEMKKWYRVVVHSKITKGDKGFMNAYLDGIQILKHKGQTAYPKQAPLTYNKFGLYRDFYVDEDKKLPPMTIYFDNYIRGSSWVEVVPEGGPIPELVETNLWPSAIKKIAPEKEKTSFFYSLFRGDFWDSDK